MRLKKRNNYTLSPEAQTIIDTVKNKSKFVSEAIVQRHRFDKLKEALNKFVKPIPNYIKGGVSPINDMAVVCENGTELLWQANEDGEFKMRLQKGDRIIRP